MDTKKLYKITWLSEGITKEDTFDVLVSKTGNISDLIDAFIKKAQLEDEAKAGPIRLYEVHGNKINKELIRNNGVTSITDYTHLVAERIPEEDRGDHVCFIQAIHFQTEPNKSHGIPFRFQIIEGEPFSETRKRLEKRTGLKGKNFEKIKFAVVRRSSYSRPTYLTDNDILWEVANENDDCLGLDHVDRSRAIRNGAGDLFLK